jgi:hypothetical protein
VAATAEERCVRMTSDRSSGCYVQTTPEATYAEPEWPTKWTFADALRWAFKDRVITDAEHSVILRAKGLE